MSWVPDLPTTGALGLAHAPGMRGPNGSGTIDGQRDLGARSAIERVRRAQPAAAETRPQEGFVARFVARLAAQAEGDRRG
mgnify:CR=1 FL=1